MDTSKLTFGKSTPETDVLLGELMLYVASKSRRQDPFGAVLLNKVLWRAEMICFHELREPLTDAEYVSLAFGPAPRGSEAIRSQLLESGAATERKASTEHSPERDVLIAEREPDLSGFSEEQLEFVDQAIHEFDGMLSVRATKATHSAAWRLGKALGSIPYECHTLSDRPVDDEDRQIARKIAQEQAW